MHYSAVYAKKYDNAVYAPNVFRVMRVRIKIGIKHVPFPYGN